MLRKLIGGYSTVHSRQRIFSQRCRYGQVPSIKDIEEKVKELSSQTPLPKWEHVSPVAQYVVQEDFPVETKLSFARTIFKRYVKPEQAKTREAVKVLDVVDQLVSNILEKSPKDKQACYWKGQVHFMLENLDDAANFYNSALSKLDDKDAELHSDIVHGLGNVELKKGNAKEALKHFIQGVELKRNLDGVLNVSVAMVTMGRGPDAIKWLEQIVKDYPDHVDAKLQLAYLYSQFGRVADAEEILSKARETDATNYKVFQKSGDLKFELHLFADAVEFYETATKMNPRDIDNYLKLGQGYLMRDRDPKVALEYCAKAMELEPTLPSPWCSAAVIYNSLGKVPETIACYLKAIELEPQNVLNRVNLANMYFQSGQLKVGEHVLKQTNPKRSQEKQLVHTLMEQCQLLMDREMETEEELRHAELEDEKLRKKEKLERSASVMSDEELKKRIGLKVEAQDSPPMEILVPHDYEIPDDSPKPKK